MSEAESNSVPSSIVVPMIYEKLALMIAQVEAIGKDKQVESGPARFKFRGIDQIYNTVHEVFAAHGVFPVAKILEHEQAERVTASGAKLYVCTIRVAYQLFARDGSSITTEAIGEAMDSGDKAANKAMSYAYKYAMMQLLCIPTEAIDGDRETHESTVDANKVSAQKLNDEIASRQTGKTLVDVPLDTKPVEMLSAKEVVAIKERAMNGPIGQMDVIEKEINTLAIRDKTLGVTEARELRNIVLTRMVVNFTGQRLAEVIQRLPMYQKRGLVSVDHANALIARWKAIQGSESVTQDSPPDEVSQVNPAESNERVDA